MFIRNLYDSHSHVVSTGQLQEQWDLTEIRDLRALSAANVPSTRRGPWLLGFGWDEGVEGAMQVWTRSSLDQIFPHEPVYLSRCDGHAGVVNSVGLELLSGGGIGQALLERTEGGGFDSDRGIAVENSHFLILRTIPAPSATEVRRSIHTACQVFNRNGYTHVRDMEGGRGSFLEALELERQGLQTLQIDWNFVCESNRDIERVLADLRELKAEQTPLNRLVGFKFYMDGSLGSRTALLSRDYGDRPGGGRGLACWSEADVETLFEKTWREGWPVACHAIGDEACDRVVEIARSVSARGTAGHLHLEHVEVLRDETIRKMKPLHVRCHLQPCHWLSDRRWLKQRTGELYRYCFQWEALRKARVPMSFGHDSPIERPVPLRTLQALKESAKDGIPALGTDPWQFMTHPDPTCVPGTTRFDGDRVVEVTLGGRIVFRED